MRSEIKKDNFGSLSGVSHLSNTAQLSMPSEWRMKGRICSTRERQKADTRLMFAGTCF